MQAIEFKLPGKRLTLVPLSAIESVVFQVKGDVVEEDSIFIGIHGWEEPFTYSGSDAAVIYEQIRSAFDPTPIHSNS